MAFKPELMFQLTRTAIYLCLYSIVALIATIFGHGLAAAPGRLVGANEAHGYDAPGDEVADLVHKKTETRTDSRLVFINVGRAGSVTVPIDVEVFHTRIVGLQRTASLASSTRLVGLPAVLTVGAVPHIMLGRNKQQLGDLFVRGNVWRVMPPMVKRVYRPRRLPRVGTTKIRYGRLAAKHWDCYQA